MTCDAAAFDNSDSDDFQRWYFGGSPPESDAWERHAFEEALGGAPAASYRCDRAARRQGGAVDREALEPVH